MKEVQGICQSGSQRSQLTRLVRFGTYLLLLGLVFGCATSGIKHVDRSSGSSSKGFVEFRIHEGAEFSIMREPVTIYITRGGEQKNLGFVGSDVLWSPAGYIHQLIVEEVPGKHNYGYIYQTMGKSLSPTGIVGMAVLPTGFAVSTVSYLGLEHCHGVIEVDVLEDHTITVTFSLGSKEVKGTLISKRLDPSQFKVEIGESHQGKPREIGK